MPFDPGRMDDPNPDPVEQFQMAVGRGEVTFPHMFEPDAPSEYLQKFADWCFDQGFAEGRNEEQMRQEVGESR